MKNWYFLTLDQYSYRNILKKGTRTYKSAGVDITSGNELINKLKTSVTRTHDNAVVTPLGSFAAAFDLEAKGFKSPLLVTGCDGVGTKLKVSLEYEEKSTIYRQYFKICIL